MFFYLIGICCVIYALALLCALFLDADFELTFYEKFGESIDRLRGKVVFITGASSGIGEHIAKSFAKHGVKLVLTARRKDELERVKGDCLDISNGKLENKDILVIVMDVLDFKSHKEHFDHALRHFGTVDILINNAGRSQRASWANISMAVDRQVFELNVFSVLNLSRIALEYFNKKGKGHIVVTTSIAGFMTFPYSASYSGSKYALHGYFNSLREEKKEIDVTLLCPGSTFTNFLQNCFTEKEGEKYGIPTQSTDKRMAVERCGKLCAIAIANKQHEAWIAIQPYMILIYLSVYMPHLYNGILKCLKRDTLNSIREGHATHHDSRN